MNTYTIANNLSQVLREIEKGALACGRDPAKIKLVVISKGQTLEKINEAYDCGCRNFGENRVVEALEKMEAVPKDIQWHFVGKMQKNKVAKVVGKFALIHSVDDLELAKKIGSESVKRGVITPILIEANISGEVSKGGLTPETWKRVFPEMLECEGIEVCGLMTMAPLTDDMGVIGKTFSGLRDLRDDLQRRAGNRAKLSELSMGMSHDFRIAIEEGATLLRIGSAIFK